jgi:hypothetical protein
MFEMAASSVQHNYAAALSAVTQHVAQRRCKRLIPFPYNKVGNVKARHETHRSVSALGVRAHPSIAVTPHARLTTLLNGIGINRCYGVSLERYDVL